MPATIAQLDARNIKKQILRQQPIEERVRLSTLLLELYPSRRNRQFVNRWIRQYGGAKKKGLVYELQIRINAEAIARHREIILANRKAKELAKKSGAPTGAVAIAPGDDGHDYFVDKDGNVLGKVPDNPASVGAKTWVKLDAE